jgi:preprotein translocase SecE subunit
MNIVSYFRETKAEMANVVWPKASTVATFTALVIISSVLVAYFLGLFDIVFARLLSILIAG